MVCVYVLYVHIYIVCVYMCAMYMCVYICELEYKEDLILLIFFETASSIELVIYSANIW